MAKKEEHILEDEILQDDELLDTDVEEFVDQDEEDLEEAELDTQASGSPAAATLAPNSKPAKTKAEMMAHVMNAMDGMSGGDMLKFFELSMAQAAKANETIDANQAAKNQATIAAKAKPVAEDLEAIFGDSEELSEEFQERVSTLFEAAVSARLMVEKAQLEEEFASKLEEQVEEISTELVENVDKYLDYVSQKWLEENKVAVENSLRSELVESFITDLGKLCKSYNFQLPEGQDEVIEQLVSRVDELEEALNESEKSNMGLSESVLELQKEVIVEQLADEVGPINYKKFKALAENIEFDGDAEKFSKKLSYIKEGFFDSKPKAASTQIINEEQIAEDADDSDSEIVYVDPAVKKLHNAISRKK